MHFHRHPFVHCFFVQHINATSQSLCSDYGVNSYTAIISRCLLLFVLYVVLRRLKTGGRFNLIFCYAFNMQNNLKSVTFFLNYSSAIFFLNFLKSFCAFHPILIIFLMFIELVPFSLGLNAIGLNLTFSP